jgi:hypothetical protein
VTNIAWLRVIGVVGLLTTACSGARKEPPLDASKQRANDGATALRFAWPASAVEAKWMSFKERPNGTTLGAVTAYFNLIVSHTSYGTRVEIDDFDASKTPNTAMLAGQNLGTINGILSGGTASSDGTQFTTNGFAAVSRAFLQIQDAIQTADKRDARTEAFIAKGLQDETIEREVMATWAALVGNLAGKVLVSDKPQTETIEFSPTLPGSPQFLGRVTTLLKAAQPCVDGGPPTCALVTRTLVPQNELQMQEYIVEVMRKGSSENVTIENFHSEDVTLSLVDPETLRPYQTMETKTLTFRVHSGEQAQEVVDRSGWQLNLAWP